MTAESTGVTDPAIKKSPAAQTSTSTTSKKVTKMRPGAVRNGRKVLFDHVQVALLLTFFSGTCVHTAGSRHSKILPMEPQPNSSNTTTP